jgi:hypothetical protein
MKSFLKIVNFIFLIVLLSGCKLNVDKIKSSFVDKNSISSSSNLAKIKGYYLDEDERPLVGINYQCGNFKGETNKNGEFFFYQNRECRFSIAKIELKYIYSMDTINSSLDAVLQEDNPKVLNFLNALNNHSIDGAITIDKKTKKVIKELKIETIPDSKIVLQATIDAINRRLNGLRRVRKISDPQVNSLAMTMGI